MEKTASQKALKVISIIMIVLAALALLLGIGGIAAGGALGLLGTSVDGRPGAMFVGGLTILASLAIVVGGGINLVIGIFGLRGANDPHKIGAFFVLSIIGVVWAAINSIGTLMGGSMDAGTIVSAICGLILPVTCCALAYSIKKENNL